MLQNVTIYVINVQENAFYHNYNGPCKLYNYDFNIHRLHNVAKNNTWQTRQQKMALPHLSYTPLLLSPFHFVTLHAPLR